MWTEQGLDTFRDKHLDRNKNIAKMVHVKTDLYNKICLYGKIAYLWTKHGDLPWIQLDTFFIIGSFRPNSICRENILGQ